MFNINIAPTKLITFPFSKSASVEQTGICVMFANLVYTGTRQAEHKKKKNTCGEHSGIDVLDRSSEQTMLAYILPLTF